MSEINPRPWRFIADVFYGETIVSADDTIVVNDGDLSFSDAEYIVKCVNGHDNLIARAEKAEAEVERLKQYIYKSGFCGYTGVDYDYHKIDCEKCFDREACERYQIVKEGWNE
jgi:hypothetical protein